MTAPSPLDQFSQAAHRAAGLVIGEYSTSFGVATKLLGARHRQHIRNVYAMVRVADEIVDGVAAQAGLTLDEQREVLDRYEHDVHRAIQSGYCSDLVIHAFATTAQQCGITRELTAPFFGSMRADIRPPAAADVVRERETSPAALPAHESGSELHQPARYDAAAHSRYVYGSAEVVGLMCLRVFARAERLAPADLARAEAGARQLGAAFQNINFLRDLADDTARLGRSYLSPTGRLDDAGRDAWVRTITAQLDDARATIPLLPRDARTAVRTALSLFESLTQRIARTRTEDLYRTRPRVPNLVKIGLTAEAALATVWERSP